MSILDLDTSLSQVKLNTRVYDKKRVFFFPYRQYFFMRCDIALFPSYHLCDQASDCDIINKAKEFQSDTSKLIKHLKILFHKAMT